MNVKTLLGTLSTAALIAAAGAAHAITYSVDFDIADGNVMGFIETDGTIGSLATANVTNYGLTLTSPNLTDGSGSEINTGNEAQFFVFGSGFTATATTIAFDFLSNSEVIFQGGPFSNFFCLDGIGRNCSGSGDSTASIGFGQGGFSDSVEFQGNVIFGTTSAVPLPASLPLAAAGFGLMGWIGRRRKTAA